MNNNDILQISKLSQEEVFKHFQTSPTGLDDNEVQKRKLLYGSNDIKSAKTFNVFKQIIKQFTSMFAILLWISGALAFFIREWQIGLSIFLVVIVNGIFSFFQESKAEKILSSLSDMMPKKIQVYRNNQIEVIDVIDLTIGDLIFLEVGATIPADLRIVQANNFFVDNSMLSGETIPLNRTANPNMQDECVAAEMPNLVYAGTTVSEGSAKAVVYSIGENTQIGQVSVLSENIDKGLSTLEKEIHRVVKKISFIASLLALVVFFVCLWRFKADNSWDKALSGAVVVALSMLVANIPEGLLPTINLSLAIGTQRMSKQNALIKQLYSVETLSSATVICTDKTGTLTKNQLTCKKIVFPGGYVDITGNGLKQEGQFKNLNQEIDDKVLKKIFIASIMASEANLIDDEKNKGDYQVVGNPTEGSLLVAASKYGLSIDEVRQNFTVEKISPFSSETKKMSVLATNVAQAKYDIGSKYLFVKGAPSVLLKECNAQYKNNQVSSFSEAEKEFFYEINEELSNQGYRILAIAYKKIEDGSLEETNIVFLGFAVNYDPPKIEVKGAVKDLLKAGLKITVITGDYGPTAISIAKQVGIIEEEYINIDGNQLEKMSQEELQDSLKTRVPVLFSRTTPKHKLRIVEAYRANDEIVGAIGDGVNDILAMKAAHIGIAMGKSGKDVARNAADMILLDDNFSTIPKAVLESRGIYSNIKKFMTYVLSSNIPQVFPIIVMTLFKVPLYLTVMQILAIDLLTDLVPAIALGAEEPEKDLLDHKPRTENDHLLDKKLLKRSYGFLGIVEGVLALVFFLAFGGYQFFGNHGIAFTDISEQAGFIYASTMAFGAVIFAQVGNAFACRSDKLYFWESYNKKNKLLFVGIISELFLFVLISQNIGFLNSFFKTKPIRCVDYLYLLLPIAVMLGFDTLRKKIINNKKSVETK